VDLKQLRYFITVMDEGGVRKAGDHLHISQPAITVAIRNLETELGVGLFERAGRKLRPTSEGLHFYKSARALLAQADRIKADISAVKSLARAKIKIAAPAMIANYVLAEPIADFMRAHPGVRIGMVQMGGPQVESALLSGDIDIGFIGRHPRAADIVAHPLYEREISAFLRRGHKLAKEKNLSWQQIFDYPIVTLPENYLLRDSILRIADHYRMPADIIVESDAVPFLATAIRKSNAIGILLESVAKKEQGIISMPLAGSGARDAMFDMRVRISACYVTGAPLSLAAKALLEHLKASAETPPQNIRKSVNQ